MGKWYRAPGQLSESTPGQKRNWHCSISFKSCKLTSVSLGGGGRYKEIPSFWAQVSYQLCHVLLMEGAPIPSLYPPFPANPVVMNVVFQFTV